LKKRIITGKKYKPVYKAEFLGICIKIIVKKATDFHLSFSLKNIYNVKAAIE
jgi:hypothetical protein